MKAAIIWTGAKAAFIYGVFDGPGHMRPALQALKEAGMEFVVFLSSFLILTDIHAVPPTDIVPWEHAQVEIALEEVFEGDSYVTVRPAYFVSNILQQKPGILNGEVRLPNLEAEFDFISSDDIGRVVGTILVNNQKN
ncbi:hypothetical protein BDV29DRAFT_185335 [Aspergillus leporis]|uniref:NmrA-like domain-containing protein n=1 Tax=Aspergillus leporis TaxID=41062 RepID=A0A5N5WLR3_9EURO|nr:hypothetical protein BDV29DRAFT_185335 [Aspergillus leporis]